MFKSIRLIAAVSLLAGLLAACGGKSNDSQPGSSAPASPAGSSAPASSEAPKEQVTLKFHFWYNEDQDNWKTVYKAFEEKYPNIKIESVTAGDNNSTEYLKKLDLAAASGDQIDVMLFSAPQYLAQRVAQGMVEPLNDYIAKDGYKMADEYAYDPAIDGKTYALPAKKVTFFTIFNKDALDEAKLPLPKDWTWDEYLDYAKKLTKGAGANKRYGTYFHTWPFYYQMVQNLQPQNYFLYKEDGTLNIDTPRIRKTLEIINQAENVDKSANSYAETISQKLNYRPQYFGGKAAMLATGDFLIPELGGTDKVPATFKTVFAPLPKMNKEDPMTTTTSGDTIAVYSKSKHKQEAYDFIRWYTTEGIQLQGKYIPSWKKADLAKSLDAIIGGTKNPEMVDKESLLYTMQSQQSQQFVVPAAYSDELDRTYLQEIEGYLLGKMDLDTAIKNAVKKGQEVLDKNKK